MAHKGDRVPTRRQFLVLSSTAALTSLLSETPASAAEAAQPYASYWHPATILDWDPSTDRDARYNRSTVPLAKRVVPARPANAHAHTGEARVQALVAYAPTSNNPAQGSLDMNYYATNYWQYIDELVFWGGSASEGLILAPNPTVTDAAHRNGVRVIGNVFLPPTAYGGQLQWVRDFVRREGDRFPVADKMIQVARHLGFDGWFLNQETAGGDAQLAGDMRDFIAYLKKSGLRVIWYDAMTNTGSVSWQNALTSRNQMFFEQSDEMFLNFWWSASGLQNSANLARQLGRSPYDLASGVDVEANGYNTSVGWASVFPEGKPHTTSLGFYRPEWTFKSAAGPADFYARDNRFWVGPNGDPSNTTTTAAWKGVAHYITELTPITSLPFVTNFNTGHGRKFAVNGTMRSSQAWNNLSLQDVLPTWRWSVKGTGTKVVPSLDWDEPYDGGTALKITGTPASANDVRLFATSLRLTANSQFEIVHRTGTGPSRLQAVLRIGTTEKVLDLGGISGAWRRSVFPLGEHAGATLTEIALRVLPGGPVTALIGRIGVTDPVMTPPAAPANVRVEQVSRTDVTTVSARLTWTRSPGSVRQYRVYKWTGSERIFLGGTANDAYFVPAIPLTSGETAQIEIETVSEAFDVSPPARVSVTGTP
ncbi:mannosyl-glycoprotein endo-beta-N-acetylglucosaminidase [Lentzea atacamensis]|uniref:Mannosyl-glycoprotein endo-beta-N-acetylglucosaminidase n=1 Tax=Lentzea atacamensis TaxID=531938 RepID=A0A316I5Z4_9PSEU|nr:mannosyl-glycoprotein endo-beta-N-acetylglucosaminidase [Lentzea atacamensis]